MDHRLAEKRISMIRGVSRSLNLGPRAINRPQLGKLRSHIWTLTERSKRRNATVAIAQIAPVPGQSPGSELEKVELLEILREDSQRDPSATLERPR